MKGCVRGYVVTGLLAASIACAQTSDMDRMPQHHHNVLEAADVPGASLYQLSVPLETADGATLALASLRGQPLLVTMFYSHCTSICPLLTAELQSIDRQLAPNQRATVRVLMVSFDAARDTPAALKSFARLHHIDDPRWIVARASASDVRLLAAALGIRYRELPDHTFNHSAVITLADRDGVVRARALGVGVVDVQFLGTLKSITATKSASQPDGG
jgi:protein SCO1